MSTHEGIQRAWRDLQRALGESIACGQVTLNINQGDVDTYDVREKKRVPPQTRHARILIDRRADRV